MKQTEEITRILNTLKTVGYVYIRQPLSLATFEMISQQLGTIELKTDIKVDPAQLQRQVHDRITGGRPSTYQAEELDFHSDNPQMNVLAWYCLKQDAREGTLYLLDTESVASHLSPQELAVLTRTNVMYSNKLSKPDQEELLKEPLLIKIGSGYRVYYQSWLLLDTYDEEQKAALEGFSEYVRHLQSTSRISVRLEEQQSLFIDNRRMLHGRGRLPEDSSRHLIRFFLRTPDIRD
jgi:Taurine catabolism dioxygenase TauD, TfdA family